MFNYNELILEPMFESAIPVAFSASNYYIPFLYVTLKSLVHNSSQNINYDIVILNKDITEENKNFLKKDLERSNISIRFLNVALFFDKEKLFICKYVPSVTIETYYRLLVPIIFKKYKKSIFLDSDTLILSDLNALYQTDLAGFSIAACCEILYQSAEAQANRPYMEHLNEIGVNDPMKFFQAGVLLYNNEYFNSHNYCQCLIKNIYSKNYRMVDQDALNELCNTSVLILNNEWNYPPLDTETSRFLQYMPDNIKKIYNSIQDPKIVHFIGAYWKPWINPNVRYSDIWWEYARNTKFYEILLQRMSNPKDLLPITGEDIAVTQKFLELLNYRNNVLKYWLFKILSYIPILKNKALLIEKKKNFKQKIRNAKNIMKQYL